MSRFRFSALLVLLLGVVAMLMLRRDRRQPVAVAPAPAPPVPAPTEPVVEEPVAEEPVVEEPVVYEPVVHEPVAEEPVIEAPQPEPVAETPPAPPVQQLYPETDGVSDADPEHSYWQVPQAPPAHWSDPPQFGERQSA
jgi:hypothetical protein